MSENWIGFVRDLAFGSKRDSQSERDRRKERLITQIAGAGGWDLSLSDKELAVLAQNQVASHAHELRLSDHEIRAMAKDVVWQVRFPLSTDA